MAKILTYNSPSGVEKKLSKENPFKSLWEKFQSADKFAKFFLLTVLLIVIATPFIVNNLLETRQRAQVPGGFVTVSGNSLFMNGQPYRFTGVNRYDLIHVDPPGPATPFCGTLWTPSELNTYFAELNSIGVDSVRFWVFQKFIYTSGVADWSRFDYVLGLAGQYGVKVIPTLENQWSACTEGGYKTESWYNTGYKAPYGSYSLSFKDFVSAIVTRYKDDSRISMWQLMNEAEIKTAEGAGSCGNSAIFRNFADDMATEVQTLDPNHLVSFGTLGAGQCGTQGADYKTLHQLSSIDVCEYHDYNHNTEAIPAGSNLLSTRIAQCNELNKPIFIGEAGIESNRCGGTYPTNQQRADYFNAKIGNFYNQGGDGYLIWSYRDNDGVPCAKYDFNSTDPLVTVLASYKPSSTTAPTLTLTPTTPPPPPPPTCPHGVTPPWPVPPGDSDCDGFPDSVSIGPPNPISSETFLGTNPTRHCAGTAARNDEPLPDMWPGDFDDNQIVNGSDLLMFAPVMGAISPDPRYNARFDLNGDGRINGSDMLVLSPFLNKTCTP